MRKSDGKFTLPYEWLTIKFKHSSNFIAFNGSSYFPCYTNRKSSNITGPKLFGRKICPPPCRKSSQALLVVINDNTFAPCEIGQMTKTVALLDYQYLKSVDQLNQMTNNFIDVFVSTRRSVIFNTAPEQRAYID